MSVFFLLTVYGLYVLVSGRFPLTLVSHPKYRISRRGTRLIGAILALTYPLDKLVTAFLNVVMPAMESNAAVAFVIIVRLTVIGIVVGVLLLIRHRARIPITEANERE